MFSTTTRVAGLLATLVALGSDGPVMAQNGLSAEGNVGFANPFPDPQFRGFSRGLVSGDFDGNGIADLAVAETAGTRMRIYRGVSWTVGVKGPVIKFLVSTIDVGFFDNVMAAGDFDGDGRDELALGSRTAQVNGLNHAGIVLVYDRAPAGTWSLQEIIRLGQDGYGGVPAQFDYLGAALAVGDFNGDAYMDLAIGFPERNVLGRIDAGAILVTYGSPAGITSAGHQFFDRGDNTVPGLPADDDHFGQALASADFDNDGYDDLAIGAPFAHCNLDSTGNRGGGVVTLYGASGGLTPAGTQWFAPGQGGVPGDCGGTGPQALASFGGALAARRLSFDLHEDLVIGAPESASGGAVVALFGQSGGLDGSSAEVIRGSDLPAALPADARFGSWLEIASLRSGAFQAASIAVGTPGDTVAGNLGAGSVWVVHATANRPDPSTAHRWTANSGLATGPSDPSDEFGTTLAVGDFNGDGTTDLAIGVPKHDGVHTSAGALQVIYQSGFIFGDGFQ